MCNGKMIGVALGVFFLALPLPLWYTVGMWVYSLWIIPTEFEDDEQIGNQVTIVVLSSIFWFLMLPGLIYETLFKRNAR